MSAVVLRCPNCGTTQAAAGECDACHESSVRYFCTNHTPGRWLVDAACPECGARFGVDAPAPRAPPRVPPPVPPRVPSPRPAAPPAAPPPAPPSRARREIPLDRAPAPVDVAASFPARPAARRPAPDIGDAMPRAVRAGASSLLGCVGKLVLVALLVLALLVAAFSGIVGGGGVRGWVVDVGQQVGVVEGVPEQTERGIAAYRAGDRTTAERELAEAARAYPRSALALLYLARLRIDAGEDFRVHELLVEAARREPESALVRRTLGEYGCALARRGRASDAADMLARAGPGPWAQCADVRQAAP